MEGLDHTFDPNVRYQNVYRKYFEDLLAVGKSRSQKIWEVLRFDPTEVHFIVDDEYDDEADESNDERNEVDGGDQCAS